MKNLFSKLALVALTLTCLNAQAETNEKFNKSALGASFSSGESNTLNVNYNKVWNSCNKRTPGAGVPLPAVYFDAAVGVGEHKETNKMSPTVSTSAALAFSCHNILLGVGASFTQQLNNTVTDDNGIEPMIIFGYNGESARVIGKIKIGDNKKDNQGNANWNRTQYTNIELGVSKTF